MKTKFFFIMLLAVLAMSPVRGQRFDWATGYGDYEGNILKGMEVDSQGNVYIIGQFVFGAEWNDDEFLWPEGLSRTEDDRYYTLIAKVSPEGDLVWKRIIAASDNPQAPFGIKMLGDSSVMCLVRIAFPGYLHQQLYYLDTIVEVTDLYDSNIDYPVASNYEGFGYGITMAFITLDLDGNLKEHHFIDETYFDADGNDYWYGDVSRNSALFALNNLSFDVDNNGNVYLCQPSEDQCAIWNYETSQLENRYASTGDIKGIRYWHNRDIQIGESQIKTPTQEWFSRIVKFSPHFDTVLAVKYVFEATDNPNFKRYTTNIKADKDNNIYIVDYLVHQMGSGEEPYAPAVITIDTIRGIELDVQGSDWYKGFLIKYDSNLEPQYFIDIQHWPMASSAQSSQCLVSTKLYDVAFDYDSNLMFVLSSLSGGSTSSAQEFYNMLQCQGVDLDDVKGNQAILIFNTEADTPTFIGYGYVPSVRSSSITNMYKLHNMVTCQNNRVIIQYNAIGGVKLPGGQAPFTDTWRYTLGHIMFDYQGNYIDDVCYYTSSPDDMIGPTILHDSVLYLGCTLASSATFGDIHYEVYGSAVSIAKYVDTALMHPYVAPQVGVPEVAGADTAAVRVWPNPARWTVNISCGEPLRGAEAINMYGRRYPLPLKGYMADISNLPQGLYILEVTTEKDKYHTKIIKL